MLVRQLVQWLPDERITRHRNLALLVTGLYLSGAVHLSLVVRHWPVGGQLPSLVNRLHRFLCNELVSPQRWYRPVAQHVLTCLSPQRLRLVIDMTQVGCRHRALVVGVAYRRRTLPLAWSLHHGPMGNVAVTQVIRLLETVNRWLPPGRDVELTADSSFNPSDLLFWLRENHWHYVIRQRPQAHIRRPDGPWLPIGSLSLAPGQTQVVGWVWVAKTNPFGLTWLTLHWAKGEPTPWILMSDIPDAKQVIRAYRRRMWVEEMFGDMKRHGFDLQSTHLLDAARIERLMLGVCMAYTWLTSLGSWVVKNGYRHLIDHKSRRDKSYFRLGWDWVVRCSRLDLFLNPHFRPY
jgi:hypothetical protein